MDKKEKARRLHGAPQLKPVCNPNHTPLDKAAQRARRSV